MITFLILRKITTSMCLKSKKKHDKIQTINNCKLSKRAR